MGKIIYNPTGGGEVDIVPVVEKHTHIRSFKDFLKYTKKMDYFFWGLAEDVDVSSFFDEDYSSSVISMVFLFGFSGITSAPMLDTHNVENASDMFYNCRRLTSVPLYDFSNLTNADDMFYGCSKLKNIPTFNFPKITSASNMFRNCSSLEVVPALNFSSISSNNGLGNGIFSNCSSLTEIHATGFKVNFNISASTRFTRAALLEILNNLETVSDTKTLTMGSTNLLKLTEEDIAIATNKNWTLA